MVELDDSDSNGLQFLSTEECLSEVSVFQNLVRNDGRNMPSFCDIPPVVAIEGRIKVVAETLENLVDLLFLQECVLQVDGHFGFGRWRLHRLLV